MSMLADKIEARMAEPIEWVIPNPKPEPKPKKPRAYFKRTSKPARVRRTKAGRAKYEADLEWSKAIRERGFCEFHDDGPSLRGFSCRRPYEAAHGLGRSFLATRHDLDNGWCLCRPSHHWFTRRLKSWTAWLIRRLGAERYEALRLKALAGPKGKV